MKSVCWIRITVNTNVYDNQYDNLKAIARSLRATVKSSDARRGKLPAPLGGAGSWEEKRKRRVGGWRWRCKEGVGGNADLPRRSLHRFSLQRPGMAVSFHHRVCWLAQVTALWSLPPPRPCLLCTCKRKWRDVKWRDACTVRRAVGLESVRERDGRVQTKVLYSNSVGSLETTFLFLSW